jgi:PD-(D/E)XK endonuclease
MKVARERGVGDGSESISRARKFKIPTSRKGREKWGTQGIVAQRGSISGVGWSAKRSGEISEAAFLWKASSLGFAVAKPWGDCEKFDFIVCGRGGKMSRVQVKSTACRYGRGWSANSCCGSGEKSGYRARDVEFVVVHVRPMDVWYVLPVRKVGRVKHLNFYPGVKGRGRWEEFLEEWELMGPQR